MDAIRLTARRNLVMESERTPAIKAMGIPIGKIFFTKFRKLTTQVALLQSRNLFPLPFKVFLFVVYLSQ